MSKLADIGKADAKEYGGKSIVLTIKTLDKNIRTRNQLNNEQNNL